MSVSKALNLAVVIFFVGCLFLVHRSHAQQKTIQQEKALLLPGNKLRLDSLGSMVARQTGFIFSFNAQKINPGLLIYFSARTITLQSLLKHLSDRYKLRHRFAGNYIIIHNEPIAARLPQLINTVGPKRPVNSAKETRQEVSRPELKSHGSIRPATKTIITTVDSSLKQSDSSTYDTTLASSTGRNPYQALTVLPALSKFYKAPFIPVRPVAAAPLVSFKHKPASNNPSTYNASAGASTSGRGDRTRRDRGSFFVAGGLAADDVFYASPTLHIGLPWLYLIGKWNTNFSVQGMSYGVGSSLYLSDEWDLSLDVTMGSLSREFRLPDTLTKKILVKGRLLRIGLQAEKEINKRWLLRFGPVLNLLYSSYYYDGKLAALSNYFPPGADIDGTYYMVKPLYTIHNSYKSSATSSSKSWIGLQLSLLYRIPSFGKEK